MKKQQSIPLVMLAIMMLFAACQRNLDKDLLPNGENLSASAKAQLKGLDTLTLDNMSMIEETPELRTLKENFEKLKKSKQGLTRNFDDYDNTLWSNLWAIRGLPVSIRTESNGYNAYLRNNGRGKELTFASSGSNFMIKVLPPSSGIPYLLYPYNDETIPVVVGYRNNNPNDKLLMMRANLNSSLFGASWDFIPANGALAIQSNDSYGQGSGGWMDIFKYTAQVGSNNKTAMGKYTKSANQHFKIRPNNIFTLAEIKFINQYSATFTRSSKYKVVRAYTNENYINKDHDFSFDDIVNETTYFKEKVRNIDFNISIPEGLKFRTPEIAGGQLFLQASTNNQPTLRYLPNQYTQEQKTLTGKLQITAEPRTRTQITYWYSVYDIDVDYEAISKFQDREIKFVGRWTGKLYVNDIPDEHTFDLTYLDTGRKVNGKINNLSRTTRIKLQ
ncbi:hypothetical protein HZP42_11695 [Elizabethkingia anophelis]|nr:hypothetical protein [Elizabethkingia anophelis]